MTTPLIINGLIQQLIDIMCASDTGHESESQNDDDTEESTEVDNMIDVVYEDETDDEPISNRNGLVRDLITLTFGAEYVLKQNIVMKNDILLIFTCKISVYATENLVMLPTLPFSNSILRYHC